MRTSPRAWCASGLEEEGLHGGDIAGPARRRPGARPSSPSRRRTARRSTGAPSTSARTASGSPRASPRRSSAGRTTSRVGDLVVCVLPGGVLPGGFEISARKTYGHVSNGMICSARRARPRRRPRRHHRADRAARRRRRRRGLTPGDDAIELLGLADEVVEVNVTPDRGYCFSMRGIAREYALSTGGAFRDPADARRSPAAQRRRVCRDAHRRRAASTGAPGCDRYVARIVRGVDVDGRHPAVDAEAAHPGRDAPDLAGRRRHQLRDDAARPAAARLRPRHPLRVGRHAAGPGRGEAHDPRRRRRGRSTPRTCSSSTAADTPAGHRRGHGRRVVRGDVLDDQRAHRGGPLRPDHGRPVLAPPPADHRGLQAVRARGRPRR